LEDKIN